MFDEGTLLLVVILLAAGYFAIVQSVCSGVYHRRTIPMIAVTVLFIYLCGAAFVGLLYLYFGNDPMVLYGALLLFTTVGLILIIRNCRRKKDTMNKKYVLLFLGYCLLVGYVTLFVRIGKGDHSIHMIPFERLTRAMEQESQELMHQAIGHDLMNLLMFVPLGYLIPMMNRKLFRKISYAFLFGVITSTLIETVQMVLWLGDCDINDIISNTAGAIIGYLLCAFYLRVRKNWRFF